MSTVHLIALLVYLCLAAAVYGALLRFRSCFAQSRASEACCARHVIVVPCHDESDTLDSCLARHANICRIHSEVSVLLLLSSRSLGAGVQRVHATAEEFRDSVLRGRLRIVECPARCDTKARKIDYLLASGVLESGDAWIILTDVDARTAEFRPIPSDPRLQRPSVYQALPVSIPSDPRCSLLAHSLALAQAERSVMELWALTRWDGRAPSRPFALGIMGACVAFNPAAVRTLRPWPEESDDIRVGYRADYLGVQRNLWPCVFRVGAPLSTRAWLQQNMRIAAGVNTRLREARLPRWRLVSAGRAVGSMLFDWVPCLRLTALLVALATVGTLPAMAPAVALCVLVQVHLQHTIFAAVNKASGATMRNDFRAAALGAFLWPAMRTCAALGWWLSGPRQRGRILAQPTPK